ncbi:MAG: hypothetical protein JNK44_08165 [Cyclobacteriaceae bacterium]|nr:hypothetical protein [Cyclobacteriaceae bacterium]
MNIANKTISKILWMLLIFLPICCIEKDRDKNNSKEAETEYLVPPKSYHKISSFLFLKKGMKLSEVIEHLESNSIKYSKPKMIKDSEFGRQNIENGEEPFKDEVFVDVFNYEIGNILLKKFRLFFLEDILFTFNLTYSYEIRNSSLTKKDFENFQNQHWALNQIFPQFYRTISEKYGNPDESSGDIHLDMFLTKSLHYRRYEEHNTYLLTNSENYRFFWNPPYSLNESEIIQNDNISILMVGGLNTNADHNLIGETRTVIVKFLNEELYAIINSRRLNEKLPESKKWDSIKNLEKEFMEKL